MARYNRSRSREYDRRDGYNDRDDSRDGRRDRLRGRGRDTDVAPRDGRRGRYNDLEEDSRNRRRGREDEYDDRRGRNDDYRSRRRSLSRDSDDRQRQRGRDRYRGSSDDDQRRDRDRSQDSDRRGQRRDDNERRVSPPADEGRKKDPQGAETTEQSSKSSVPDWVRDLVEPTAAPAPAPLATGQRFIMIPEQFVSKVLGYQRCIINEIQATTQTSIHMNQNLGKGYTVATITSTVAGAVEKAEAMINSRIEAGMKTQASYAQGYHGMGKGGKASLSSGGVLPYGSIKM